ncbi:hypothetical protein HanHA300_Chr02g0047421 [Helianthus annuus]|nr:hypothetical protein HanHA300_Chr02g0047421 [Helianthus annuus]
MIGIRPESPVQTVKLKNRSTTLLDTDSPPQLEEKVMEDTDSPPNKP